MIIKPVVGKMSPAAVKFLVLACIILVPLCSAEPQGEDETLLVRTAQGPVRGFKDPTHGIFTFYGIPYATAPTGRDRYKAPLPAPKWLTPFEAKDDTIVCPQAKIPLSEIYMKEKHVREDCLIANVFVPDTKEKNIPVVVYVHGGAFQMGNGNLFYSKNFVKKENIIVVTFNYRLGIHGFLCLGTEDVPGNAGMKDQVALLRWVKNNIANFGGNPDDVTLAGYSAGSAAVDLLMLSPITKGLFTKVIPESGGNLAAFAVQTDPIESAKIFAKQLNIPNTDDIRSLEEFYKTASFETITSDSFFARKDSTFLFSPCVERQTGGEMFLSDSPYNILKTGNYNKVPLLYGFASMEGLLRIDFFPYWKDGMNEKFSDFLPIDLQFENDNEKDRVANEIKEFYFGNKKVNEDSVLNYVDYFSDVIFAYPMMKAVEFHAKAGHDKVYLYEFSFVDEQTPVVPHTNVRGANHCAQTATVLDAFGTVMSNESNLTNEYRQMKDTVREIWGNFAKTGSPIPKGSQLPAWPAVGARGAPYMSLGSPIQLVKEPLLAERMAMWDKVYEKHYRPPVAPSQPNETPKIIHTEI